jgi:type IX secretion system PorP/SprF family membrane protein
MKKIILPILLLLSTWHPGFSQDYFHMSQFTQSAYAINPAFSGIEEYIDVKIGYRRQWSNINGTPTTYYVGVNLSNRSLFQTGDADKSVRTSDPSLLEEEVTSTEMIRSKHGFGLYALNNQQGAFSRNGVYLTYAYHHVLPNGWSVAAGASADIINEKFDELNASVFNPDLDEIYQAYRNGMRTGTSIGLNGGALLYTNQFYLGYSIHNAVHTNLASDAIDQTQLSELYHFVMGGMHFDVDPEFSLHPSVFFKYSEAFSYSFDVNCKLQYREFGWVGASYRNSTNSTDVVGMLGFFINHRINLGYSYDFSTSRLGRDSSGTHELVLSLMLANPNEALPFLK